MFGPDPRFRESTRQKPRIGNAARSVVFERRKIKSEVCRFSDLILGVQVTFHTVGLNSGKPLIGRSQDFARRYERSLRRPGYH